MALKWETLESKGLGWRKKMIRRAKVPGGWLIMAYGDVGAHIVFLPDPNHEWDGNSPD